MPEDRSESNIGLKTVLGIAVTLLAAMIGWSASQADRIAALEAGRQVADKRIELIEISQRNYPDRLARIETKIENVQELLRRTREQR